MCVRLSSRAHRALEHQPTSEELAEEGTTIMKVTPLAAGAVLGALSAFSLALPAQADTAQAQPLSAAAPSQTTRFSVYLPLTHQDQLEQLLQDQTDSNSSRYHAWLTPGQFKQQFGPSRADIAAATALLRTAGFTIVEEKTQNLIVEGPVSALNKTFSTHMQWVRTRHGRNKLAAQNNRLTLPQALAAMGAVIPSFSAHEFAQPHSRVLARGVDLKDSPGFRFSSIGFYYPNDLNEAYRFPSFRAQVTPRGSRHPAQIAGVGAHIGIVISSVIDPADLAATFNSDFKRSNGQDLIQAYSKFSNLPVPTVTIRPVLGGSGAFDPNTADGAEASLDTQMSLGTAPGATETVYNMPDLSDDSIIAAYTDVDEDNLVDVANSSFGGCELFYTAPYNGGVDMTGILKVYHALFQQGNAQGITFVASSGDNGALACNTVDYIVNQAQGTSFILGVSHPAVDPNVTSVGGTNLVTSATPGPDDATYLTENADFDFRLTEDVFFPNDPVSNNIWGSGGGISTIFKKPAYQLLAPTGSAKFRTVPDLSLMMGGCPGDADLDKQDCTQLPRSAILVWIGGQLSLLIGTSASAPEFAGVVALAVELNGGRLGNVNPQIYALGAVQTLIGGEHAPQPLHFFHRVASGNNGFYTVSPNQAYSKVLGQGTLDVVNFLGIPFQPTAGTPNSKTNP
jgi:subtilase family serine protease